MNGEERRGEVARYWLEKAWASLESALREFAQGQMDFSANRLYYAAFYAVSAALAARGKSYSKHSAVRSAFHKELIKVSVLDVRFAKLYDRLFYIRQKADYEVFTELDPQVLEADAAQVEEFLTVMRDLVERELAKNDQE